MVNLEVLFIPLAVSSSTDYGQLSETLSTVTIVSYVLAGVFLAFAVFSFIIFKIPNVIGDLSGRNAKKSIAQMRENNEKSGKKSDSDLRTRQKRDIKDNCRKYAQNPLIMES